jgi:hypothetical protein
MIIISAVLALKITVHKCILIFIILFLPPVLTFTFFYLCLTVALQIIMYKI